MLFVFVLFISNCSVCFPFPPLEADRFFIGFLDSFVFSVFYLGLGGSVTPPSSSGSPRPCKPYFSNMPASISICANCQNRWIGTNLPRPRTGSGPKIDPNGSGLSRTVSLCSFLFSGKVLVRFLPDRFISVAYVGNGNTWKSCKWTKQCSEQVLHELSVYIYIYIYDFTLYIYI